MALSKALNQIYSPVQSDHAINWLIAEPKYYNLRTTDLVLYDKGGSFDQLKMRMKSKANFVGFILLRWLVVNPVRCQRKHMSKYVFGRFVGTQVKPEMKKAFSSNLRKLVQPFDVRHLSMRADETMTGWSAKNLNCELMRLSQAPRSFYIHDMPALAVKEAVTAQICHQEQQERQQQFEQLQAENIALKKQMQQMRQEIEQLRNAVSENSMAERVDSKNEFAQAVDDVDERAEFCEACASGMLVNRSLRSRNPHPIQVYDYCKDLSEDGTYIKGIFLLIFEFSRTPVDLIVVAGGGGSSTVRSGGGSFTVQPAAPGSMFVRSNLCVPIKHGSYYYEFKVAQDAVFDCHGNDRDFVEVGWCDEQWNPPVIGRDPHSWMAIGYTLESVPTVPTVPDDVDSDDLSELPSPVGLQRATGRGDLRSPWSGGDVIGCGVHRYSDHFRIIYFLNGELTNEQDCAFVGQLYPAARVCGNKQHQMIFGASDLQYLPEDFAPLYSEM